MSADIERRGRLKALLSKTFPNAKEMINLLGSAVLVFVGVLGYFLLREQLDLMWLQTAITQNQMLDAERSDRRARQDIDRSFERQKQLAEATSSMAQEFQKQTVQSRDSLRLDQRAWIVVSALHAETGIGKPLTFRVTLTNTGRTPARKMTGYAASEVDVVPFSVEIRGTVPPSHYAIFFSVTTAASRALMN